MLMDFFNYLDQAHKKISTYFVRPHTKYTVSELTLTRTEAFKIQAFGRILKSAGKKSSDEGKMIRTLGENLKTSSKFIEDCIGEFLHHHEMSVSSKNKSRLDEAEMRFTILKGDIAQHIAWLGKSLDLVKNLELKTLYLKGLTRELKKLEDSIEEINPILLEDGTHKLRRKLRWAIMHIIYPQGLFAYKEHNIKMNEYTELKPSTDGETIKISFTSINFLSAAVFELGKAKDEGLKENYNKTRSEINSSKPQIVALTKEVLADLKRNKVLSKLRSEIKSQI